MGEPETFEQRVGKEIKRRRDKDSIKQEVLAEMAGIDRGCLSKLENGERSMKLSTLKRISDALGVPPQDLLK